MRLEGGSTRLMQGAGRTLLRLAPGVLAAIASLVLTLLAPVLRAVVGFMRLTLPRTRGRDRAVGAVQPPGLAAVAAEEEQAAAFASAQ